MEKWFPKLFPFFFVGMWIYVSLFLSKISGWSALAESYRADTDFEGERWYMESSRMNGISYNSCLIFGSSRKGFYMKVIFPFNIGSKPLLIPWKDISVMNYKGWLFDYITLRFERHPEVYIRILKKSWIKILNCKYTPRELLNIQEAA